MGSGENWTLNHRPPSYYACHKLGVICPTKSYNWACTAAPHQQVIVVYMQWGPSSPRKVTWSSPNAHGPHLYHTIFFSPTCTYEITGSLLWSVDRKIKLEPGLQMVNLHDTQAPPENEQLQHYSPFLGHTWRSVINRKFPSGQNFKQCSWLLFFLGSRHGEMCDYIIMYRLGPMAFLDGQGLWIKWLKNWWQGTWGRILRIGLSDWAKTQGYLCPM